MFLRSLSNFNDSETVTTKKIIQKTYYLQKNVYYSRKLISLCSEKLDQIKYPQKLMSGNSKAETFKNQ